jgi:hypothetical protein
LTKKKTFGLIAFAVLATVLLVLFFPRLGNKTPNWKRPPWILFLNAHLIGNNLAQYRSDHNGRLSSRLSELVPNYVEYTNIQLFFWPPKPWTITNANSENLSREIDDDGIFVYMEERGFQENVILYERTNLWPKNQEAAGVVTLTTNFTTKLLSVRDVETRLSNLPPVEVK